MTDIISDAVETVEELGEELFPPRPGGLVERHRAERARREAAQKEAENSAERVEEGNYKSVKVTQLSPQITATNQVTIPTGATAMVLPLSEYRFRAIIISTAAVILAKDQSQALGGTGYPLAANTPFTVNSRAQLWAFATATAVVSSFSEIYAPEQI